MMTLVYLLVVLGALWLAWMLADERFNLTHRLKRRRSKAFWRERNKREGRGRRS